MNDIDFAISISNPIGSLYKSAKENGSDLPDYSLGQLRGLCKLICDLIAQKNTLDLSNTSSLDEKIYSLFKEKLINQKTKDKLHQLRMNGNKGAHPEQYTLTKEEFTNLFEQSLVVSRELLEVAYECLNPNATIPEYKVEFIGSSLKELCYQAVTDDDPEAKYTLGKFFINKAENLEKELKAASPGFYILGFEYRSFLDRAYLWFKQAADSRHTPSMYEYGFFLAKDSEDKNKMEEGKRLVYTASNFGNVYAQVVMGQWYLYGEQGYEINIEEARYYFELAAAEDHPIALAHLGVIYQSGEQKNLEAAFKCTRRAAEAGFPMGQYNLFVAYFNGKGVDKDEFTAINWLTKAAEQKMPEAILTLARCIVAGYVKGKTNADAEALYLDYLKYNNIENEACYELAQLYLADQSNYENLLKAADLLQNCYELEKGNGELAKKCWKQSPVLVRKLKDALRSIAASDQKLSESTILLLQYFDPSGHPVKNRDEVNKILFDKFSSVKNNSDTQKLADHLLSQVASKQTQARVILLSNRKEKVGRNDSCPCGSEKKFKVCCGR